MDYVLNVLKDCGPFTAPISLLLVGAIYWLNGERIREIKRAVDAETDSRQLRDQRTIDQTAATRAMGEFGENMRRSIEHFTSAVQQVDARVQTFVDVVEKWQP
jgi:hypothetical protein